MKKRFKLSKITHFLNIKHNDQWCRFMLSTGRKICNFTPILPYFKHWGMKLDHYFFHLSKLSEDQKKRSSPKTKETLSP